MDFTTAGRNVCTVMVSMFVCTTGSLVCANACMRGKRMHHPMKRRDAFGSVKAKDDFLDSHRLAAGNK